MTESIQRKRNRLEIIYLILMGFCLLSFFYLTITDAEAEFGRTSSIPVWVWILRLSVLVPAVMLGREKINKGFLFLLLYYAWIILRILIPDLSAAFRQDTAESILAGAWLFMGCYGIGSVSEKYRGRFLSIASAVWITGILALCITGLLSTSADHYLYNPGHGSIIGIYAGRMMFFFLPTTTGAILSLTLMISFCALISSRQKLLRILLVVAILPMLLCLSLTDSRTSFISFAAGIGVIAFICMMKAFHKKGYHWVHWLAAAAAMLLIAVVTMIAVMKLTDVYNRLRGNGGLFISTAYAEKLGSNRGLSGGSDVLNGRWEIWKGVFQVFRENPLLLLTGASKAAPMTAVNNLLGINYAHCHNTLLQVLLESGIPGLLLLLFFIGYTIRCSFRLISSSGTPMWQRLLPAIFISGCVGDLAECFNWLLVTQCPMNTVLFMVAGLICTLGGKKQNGKDRKGEPLIWEN